MHLYLAQSYPEGWGGVKLTVTSMNLYLAMSGKDDSETRQGGIPALFSAMADSTIFPTIAFGSFMPLIVLGQFAAKVSGGFIWAFIISRFREKKVRAVRVS